MLRRTLISIRRNYFNTINSTHHLIPKTKLIGYLLIGNTFLSNFYFKSFCTEINESEIKESRINKVKINRNNFNEIIESIFDETTLKETKIFMYQRRYKIFDPYSLVYFFFSIEDDVNRLHHDRYTGVPFFSPVKYIHFTPDKIIEFAKQTQGVEFVDQVRKILITVINIQKPPDPKFDNTDHLMFEEVPHCGWDLTKSRIEELCFSYSKVLTTFFPEELPDKFPNSFPTHIKF